MVAHARSRGVSKREPIVECLPSLEVPSIGYLDPLGSKDIDFNESEG